MKRILPAALAVALLTAIPSASAKDDKWVEARSANFIVVSNASAQQARNTAIQFEQIRELFRQSFAYTKDRPTPVITILAAKDEGTLRELLPEYWAEKGRVHPAGIFVQSLYQPAIAVQLSGIGDNPYEAVYHEYYHSLTVPYFPNLPVWVAEGLADLYGNSKVSDKTAALGVPNVNLIGLLRQQSLIPLSTLLQVDHASPYYNENSKVSMFYAESWALTHYMMLGENGVHRRELAAYLDALGQGASQEEAAAKAFGDIGKLQKSLQSYVSSASFYELRTPAPPKIPESDIQVRQLSDAEAGAYRGGFLSLHQQYKEADALLRESARLDPRLALAQQNLAVSYYLQGKSTDALTALSAAIQLDPRNTYTRFLRAQIAYRKGGQELDDSPVEDDLRAAIAANPNFAPAYALLATYLAASGEQLPDALEFAKKGASLEPGNSSYQLVLAQVLGRMRQYDAAQTVALRARASALDSVGRANADQFMEYLRRVRDAVARNEISNQRIQTTPSAAATGTTPTLDTPDDTEKPEADEPQVKDDRPRVDGTITEVQCKAQSMQITVLSQNGPVKLHSSDYTNIEFISDAPIKSEEFWPCTSLKGHAVRVKYLAGPANQTFLGEIGSVEIRR